MVALSRSKHAHADRLRERELEVEVILERRAHRTTGQTLGVDLSVADSIGKDAARSRRAQTQQDLGESRLAGAVFAYQGNSFPGAEPQLEAWARSHRHRHGGVIHRKSSSHGTDYAKGCK